MPDEKTWRMASISWQMETMSFAKLIGDDSESTVSGPASDSPLLPSSPRADSPPSSPGEILDTPKLEVVALSDLPSIGSLGHFAGQCSRCCFHPKGRCLNGYNCRYCHFEHDKRRRKRKTVDTTGVARHGGFDTCDGNQWGKPTTRYIAHLEQSACGMPDDVNSWSIDRVSSWLGFAGLGHLAGAFQAHRITGDVLLDLSLDDFAEIGVHALGDKKRLLRAVAQLRTPQVCPPLVAPPSQDPYLQQPCPSPFMQQCGPQSCAPMCPPPYPPPPLQCCGQQDYPQTFTQSCTSAPPPPVVPAMSSALALASAPQWI